MILKCLMSSMQQEDVSRACLSSCVWFYSRPTFDRCSLNRLMFGQKFTAVWKITSGSCWGSLLRYNSCVWSSPPRLLLHTWLQAREYLRVSKAALPSRLCAVAATEPGLKGRKRIPDRLYRKCDPILSLNQHSLNMPDINHLMGGAEGELGVGCSIQGHWTCTEYVRQLNFPFSTVSAKEWCHTFR